MRLYAGLKPFSTHSLDCISPNSGSVASRLVRTRQRTQHWRAGLSRFRRSATLSLAQERCTRLRTASLC